MDEQNNKFRIIDCPYGFKTIRSPSIQRSAKTGRFIYVSDEQREKNRKRAKRLGLKWYV